MPNARPPLAAAGLLTATALLAAGCGATTGTGAGLPSGSPSVPTYGDYTSPGHPSAGHPSTGYPSAGYPSAAAGTTTGTSTATSGGSAPATATAGGVPRGGVPRGAAHGVFAPNRSGATAITYDPAVVPTGATATVTTTPAGSGVTVRLAVTGMIPGRAYGAHLHTEPCGGTPAHAGPHYQNVPDPKAIASPPSVDPKFANPRNEVWLDFTAGATGSATARTTVTWPFDGVSPPRSLIVHAERTRTGPGQAGAAGPRAACLTLPL